MNPNISKKIKLNSLAKNPLFLNTKPGKSIQKNPLGFFDIGARGGVHEVVAPIACNTSVMAFEPDKKAFLELKKNQLKSSQWAELQLESFAINNKICKQDLNQANAPVTNSLKNPNEKLIDRYGMNNHKSISRDTVDVKTLDSVVFSKKNIYRNMGEFIKSDTQGSDFEVWEGGLKTLNEKTVALITEVFFCEVYEGQKLFSETEMLLREQGFTFYGFTYLETRYKNKNFLNKKTSVFRERTICADAVFLKDPLAGINIKNPIDERGIYVLFIVSLLLGYFDFSIELAFSTWLTESDETEQKNIKALIIELSNLPPSHTQKEIDILFKKIKENPGYANITIGRFVDRRRPICNYDDVFKISHWKPSY